MTKKTRSRKRSRIAGTTARSLSTYDIAVRVENDPHGVLRKRSELVVDVPAVKELADKMRGIVARDEGCIGLAAPQVGENVRVIVLRLSYPHGLPVVIINPEIEPVPGSETEEDYEGCYSLQGSKVVVTRYSAVTLHGLNAAGVPVSLPLEGLMARAAQHEVDHLNGKLISDHGPLIDAYGRYG